MEGPKGPEGTNGLEGSCLISVFHVYNKHIDDSTCLGFIGRDLTRAEQYGLVLLISLPLFILASAGSTVFWIIGVYAMY